MAGTIDVGHPEHDDAAITVASFFRDLATAAESLAAMLRVIREVEQRLGDGA